MVSKFLHGKNRFIHHADVSILMARQLMMTDEDNSTLDYLKYAMSQWVITSEVRMQKQLCHNVKILKCPS